MPCDPLCRRGGRGIPTPAAPPCEMAIETATSRNAPASPPGTCVRCRSRPGRVWVSPGMLETKVMVAPNSPSALAKHSIMPAMMPGSASGNVTVSEHPDRAGAQRGGGRLEPAVDRLDRKPDRPHHQRKAHTRRSQCRARPAEGTRCRDLVQKAAHRPAPSERDQQQIARHHRRQHQRQCTSPSSSACPGKPCAPAPKRRSMPKGRLASIATSATCNDRRSACPPSGPNQSAITGSCRHRAQGG